MATASSEGPPSGPISLDSQAAGSDWELLRRAGKGDDAAFALLVERHQDKIVNLCTRYLSDRQEALDASQEVFLTAFRKAGRVQEKAQFSTWLYRVGVNHCLNRLRRRKVVRFFSFSHPDPGEVGEVFDPEDDAAGPEARLEQKRRWAAVRAAIDGLPESQRTVLILIRYQGLSYRETAEIVGATEGAVESRLMRAMKSLGRALEKV